MNCTLGRKFITVCTPTQDLYTTYITAKQFDTSVFVLDGGLDALNLHGDGRKNSFFKTVELVETAPSSTFDQSDKDTTHWFHIDTLVEVKTIIIDDFGSKLFSLLSPYWLHGEAIIVKANPKAIATVYHEEEF